MKKGEQLSGFNYDASRNETVVLGAGANAINVYYTKAIYVNQPATLTVNHIGVTVAEDGTETNKVLSTETLNGYTEKDVVTSADVRKGDTLSGYDYDSSRDESIVLGVGATRSMSTISRKKWTLTTIKHRLFPRIRRTTVRMKRTAARSRPAMERKTVTAKKKPILLMRMSR